MTTTEITSMDAEFMAAALSQAKKAAAYGEVPIGAVVVYEGTIISAGYNRCEIDVDPSAHAEFSALREAVRLLGRWRLTGCTVYVTLEPCLMCAGLMQQARIDRCVYGASDPKGGALGSLYRVHEDIRLNHSFAVTAGVCAQECSALLSEFFADLRAQKKLLVQEPLVERQQEEKTGVLEPKNHEVPAPTKELT